MAVKSVPTLGWTRGSVAATILLVTQQQRDEIAARVRAEMAQRGWNNPKLAREAGLSEKTISRLINARKDARLDTIERVAQAFGVDPREIQGPPPAPLGLVADNGRPTQLDEIEAKLDRILDLLARDQIVEGVQKDAQQAAQPAPATGQRRASRARAR